MSYMICPKCGGGVGVVGSTVFSCSCKSEPVFTQSEVDSARQQERAGAVKAVEIICEYRSQGKNGAALNAVGEDYPEILASIDAAMREAAAKAYERCAGRINPGYDAPFRYIDVFLAWATAARSEHPQGGNGE